MPNWLKNAVFYEIYPQSFFDTNGDGIGDLDGIVEKLDYILDLGCNAIWLNPCYDSPFKDAGYDVRDYKKVAPRYGTNENLYRLFGEAHKRGMHILLDLIPGHTSEEHPWFVASKKQERNEYSDRYVWADHSFRMEKFPYIAGESERDGIYMLNFFKCQPALNYGFENPEEPWQMPADHPACVATREAIKDVMRFWLDRGCDGFRVDMADYLVKGEGPEKKGTCAIWKDIRTMMEKDYPDAALVSEWSNPKYSVPAGFHMDFLLNNPGTGYSTLLRDYVNGDEDHSFFKKDGNGDITRFLEDYLPKYEETKGKGYVSLISGNHDTPRARRYLDIPELKVFYTFLFTMPGVPYLYYGDEIGMRYLSLPTKEGGYGRTGSRSPMQWSRGKNLGFSTAFPEDLYLPVDAEADAPTVEESQKDPDSLYHVIRNLLHLRHEQEDLQSDGEFEVLYGEKEALPFVYRRGNFCIALNPSTEKETYELPKDFQEANIVFAVGKEQLQQGTLTLVPQSAYILKA